MGVDLVVVGEHRLSQKDLGSVDGLLKPALDVIGRREKQFRRMRWSNPIVRYFKTGESLIWKSEKYETYLSLNGPYSTWIDIGPTLYAIHTMPRWHTFLNDIEVQQTVQEFCESIAIYLGSGCLLYVPDSMYAASYAADLWEEPVDIEFALKAQYEHAGPPFSNFGSITKEAGNYIENSGYCISNLQESGIWQTGTHA